MHLAIGTLQEFGNGFSGITIGAGLGLYATIVFQRYTKFRDITAELAYRMLTLGEHVAQIDHRCNNPSNMWVAASQVIRDCTGPSYFFLVAYKHEKARAALQNELDRILNDLFTISDGIARMSGDDPQLTQINGDRSLLVGIRWGFYFNERRDAWAQQVLELGPDWSRVVWNLPDHVPDERASGV